MVVLEHELAGAHDGARVEVAVGDTVVLRLPENGGTGFLWALDLPEPVRLVEDAPEPAPLTGGVGGTGLHRFVLDVGRAGEHAVSGRLAQPWAPDVVEATFSVVLVAS